MRLNESKLQGIANALREIQVSIDSGFCILSVILYLRNSKSGLEILAFPCNNFGGQEPGTNAEIQEFAKSKGATFPVLGKIECDNGEQTDPLYKYLKASLPNGIIGQGLKWNFAKFLCNSEGVPVKRYLPTTSPLGIEADIQELLKIKAGATAKEET